MPLVKVAVVVPESRQVSVPGPAASRASHTQLVLLTATRLPAALDRNTEGGRIIGSSSRTCRPHNISTDYRVEHENPEEELF